MSVSKSLFCVLRFYWNGRVIIYARIYYHIYIYSYINGKLLHERKSSICKADSVEDELHIKLFMLYNIINYINVSWFIWERWVLHVLFYSVFSYIYFSYMYKSSKHQRIIWKSLGKCMSFLISICTIVSE